jgi:hypothetical protein
VRRGLHLYFFCCDAPQNILKLGLKCVGVDGASLMKNGAIDAETYKQ